LTCAGSNPVSADSKRTRSTFEPISTSLVGSAASARADAISPALPSVKLRRSMPRTRASSGARHRRRLAVVDVDVVPPLLPERRSPVADHALLRHVDRDAVEGELVRHVGDREPLGLAKRRRPFGAVGELLELVVQLVELRQPDAG